MPTVEATLALATACAHIKAVLWAQAEDWMLDEIEVEIDLDGGTARVDTPIRSYSLRRKGAQMTIDGKPYMSLEALTIYVIQAHTAACETRDTAN